MTNQKINVERLGTLLDRAAGHIAAAQLARNWMDEDRQALRFAEGELAEQQARLATFRGLPEGQAVVSARVDAKRAERDRIVANSERRRRALNVLNRRAGLWSSYADSLRALADGHGVEL